MRDGLVEKDYYGVLGLKKGASTDEIKRAYKELAKKYHPDVSSDKDAEKKFKEVSEAYSVLSDPEKKTNYDNYGNTYKQFEGFQGFDFGKGMDIDFEDIFNQFGFESFGEFGRSFGSTNRAGGDFGSNIKVEVSLSFEEAAFGITREINYSRTVKCRKCGGSGAEKGEFETCKVCKGKGFVTRQTNAGPILFQSRGICHHCRGVGKVPKEKCHECGGNGLLTKKISVEVKIPAGINTGNHLRVKGHGNEGRDGSGDLFVIIFVEPHKIFKRDNEDIYTEIPISFTEAALGATIEVPTLRGKADLKIPAGTQTGTIFKMKEKGIKKLGKDSFGDEYVKVIVETPKKISEKQQKLLEEMEKEEQLAKKRKSFFSKILGKF
ncbi:MAG: molecular chaperone DnaJ [archaeon]